VKYHGPNRTGYFPDQRSGKYHSDIDFEEHNKPIILVENYFYVPLGLEYLPSGRYDVPLGLEYLPSGRYDVQIVD